MAIQGALHPQTAYRYAAEVRGPAGFWPHGPLAPPAEQRDPDFPSPLDLRYRDAC